VELFICVLANLRGLKGACNRRQKILTGWEVLKLCRPLKKEAYGPPEACAHHSILYVVVSRCRRNNFFIFWLTSVDDAMADNEELHVSFAISSKSKAKTKPEGSNCTFSFSVVCF
jgi:hypothetical protein